MLKQSLPVEKRQFERRQSGCHGWVKVRGRPAIPCVIKNISQGGALLEFQAAELLPYRFGLVIASEGIDSDCETRHQTGNRMGVEFVRSERVVQTGGHSRVPGFSTRTPHRR